MPSEIIERNRRPMKTMALACAVLSLAMTAPSVFAQDHDHGEFGVYGDYFRLSEAGNANFEGVGGRIGLNVAPRVQLEGQMTYDFAQSFTFTDNGVSGGTIGRSSLTRWHGLFGPKLVLGTD